MPERGLVSFAWRLSTQGIEHVVKDFLRLLYTPAPKSVERMLNCAVSVQRKTFELPRTLASPGTSFEAVNDDNGGAKSRSSM